MKRSNHLMRRLVLLLLCIFLCMTAAVPATAASKKGTVTGVSVTNVSKGSLSLNKGKTFTLKVSVKGKGNYSKAVKYKSSNSKVVSVTSKGKLKALKKGTATITVTSSANSKKKATVKVTVKIPVTKVKLNKTKATIAKGKTLQLKATVEPSSASNKKVTWKSSNTKVAAVSTAGKVTAKAAGKATITATAKDGSKKSASCVITVKIPVTSVSLDKKTVVLEKNATAQLKATVSPSNASNKKVTFASSDAKTVSVDEDGNIKGLKNGKATITVTTADGKKTASCEVTVKTSAKSVKLTVPERMKAGTEEKATAKVAPTDAVGVTYTYESSDSNVATVSNDGTIKAVANGTATVKVTASDYRGNKVTDSTKITVFTPVESVSFADASIILNKGEEKTLAPSVLPKTASDKKVSFASSHPEIASVDQKGLVKALSIGKTTITVTTNDGGKTAECEIVVRSAVTGLSLNIPDKIVVGSEIQAEASYTPADAEGVSLIFQGDNRNVAEVSEEGAVKAVANGIVKVMATATDRYGNIAYDEKTVTVWTPVSEVRLSDENLVLYVNEEKQLMVTVLPDEASQKKVYFSSSDENIATVSESGLIRAVAEGNVTVTAVSEDGEHTAFCSVEVKKVQTNATVSSQEDLDSALQNEKLQQLTISSENEVSLTIPDGDYSQVALTVNLPQGHIENYGVFKNIVIKAIGGASFVEHADGNNIIYKSNSGRLVTEPGASVNTLTLDEGASSLDLVNNGNIANVMISTQANVRISGENESRLNVTATQSAENTTIQTSITLKVEAEATINIDLLSGSDNTMVSVDTQDNIPVLTGIGEVAVTTRDTGVTESVLAENIGSVEAQSFKISGTVQSTGQSGIKDANVYLIPYSSNISDETIAAHIDEALAVAMTDENGMFVSEEIPMGNYYAYVVSEGYLPVCRRLSADSSYNSDTYPFGNITMLGENETENGSIAGTLTNARTNAPVEEGITVRLRSGAENKTSSWIAQTVTDQNGSYTFNDLPAGQYTVQALDLRQEENGFYITDYATITVGGGTVADGGFPIRFSASGAGNQVTFTLEWGDESSGASSDLDSHLTGPTPSGGRFHTWYASLEYYYYGDEGNSGRYDFLDYDDTTWVGPENTTIEKSVDGIYSFYVHDYTNRDNPDSSQMSRSSAVVTVHSSEGTIGVYRMPNETGNLWHVCDYDSGTGKITAVNKVYRFTGEPSDVGVDLVEKYRELLREYLEKAELMKNMADESTLAMLADAQNVLAASEDSNELMEAYQNVREFVNSVMNGLRIDYVYGDTVTGYSYNTDEIITGDVSLTISGYDPELSTDKIQFSLYSEESSWEWRQDSSDAASFMIVVTNSRGNSCRYHVTYEPNTNDCSVDNVTAVRDGESLIYNWYSGCEYIGEGDDEQEIYVLTVEGMDLSIPSELTVTARNPYAAVGAVTASDINGYDGKVTITAGESAQTYYIRWKVSSEILKVGSVSAESDNGTNLLSDWYGDYEWYYDDETEDEYRLYYIYASSYTSDVLQYLKVESKFSSVEAGEIVPSDRSGYDKMVTFTCGDMTRTWYIRLNVIDYVFDIDCIDAYDEEDNDVSLQWSSKKEYGEDGNAVRSYLDIHGASETMPAKMVFYPYYGEAVCGELEASDVDGYDGRFTVTYRGAQKNWYIRYSLGDQVCEIDNIKAVNDDGDSLIDYLNKGSDWVWDEELQEDVKLYYAYVYGYAPSIPENLEVTARYGGVTVGEIMDSDRPGYDKMVTLSRGSISRTYYITWKITPAILDVGNVTAEDGDGNSLLSNWYWDHGWFYDDETGEEYDVYYISTDSYISDALQYLKVEPNFGSVEAGEIVSSDRSGYDKMVTFTCGDMTRTWYIRLNIIDYVFDIDYIDAYDEEDNYVSLQWNSKKEYDGDGNAVRSYLDIQGVSETMPARMEYYPSYGEAVCGELEASDVDGYDGKFTVTYRGLQKTWYIRYRMGDQVCEIGRFEAVNNEGDSLIDYYGTSSDWVWDEELQKDVEIHYAYVYGYTPSIPGNLEVTARYGGVTVGEIMDSDRPGYEKMVTLSRGSISRTYYITWRVASSILNVGNVTAEDGDGNNLLSGWYWDNDWYCGDEPEDDYTLYYIDASSYTSDALQYLRVEPRFGSVEAGEIVDSDCSGFDKMVTFTFGDMTRTWYIRLNTIDYVFDICDIYAYDEEGNYISLQWNSKKEYDGDGNVVRAYLDIQGASETMPARMEYYPNYGEAVCGELEASDVDGYDGKITVTYKGAQKTWYIRYSQNDEVCAMESIYAVDDDGNSLIDDYWISSSWIHDVNLDEDVLVHYVYVKALRPIDLADVTVSPRNSGVTVSEIMDSDRADYEKMVTLSKGSVSRNYYFDWNISMGLFNIGDVTAEDEEGNSMIAEYWTDPYNGVNMDTGEEYNTIYIKTYSSMDDVMQSLNVIPRYSIVEVSEIVDSDLDCCDKMLVFSAYGATKRWYISFIVEEQTNPSGDEGAVSSEASGSQESADVPNEENDETTQNVMMDEDVTDSADGNTAVEPDQQEISEEAVSVPDDRKEAASESGRQETEEETVPSSDDEETVDDSNLQAEDEAKPDEEKDEDESEPQTEDTADPDEEETVDEPAEQDVPEQSLESGEESETEEKSVTEEEESLTEEESEEEVSSEAVESVDGAVRQPSDSGEGSEAEDISVP